MQRQANLQEKRTTIMGLLAGKLTVHDLREPKHYFVFNTKRYEDGRLMEEETFEVEGLKMNRGEYELWKKENVLPLDSVVVFEEDLSYTAFVDVPGTNISCSADMVEHFLPKQTKTLPVSTTAKELVIIPKHYAEVKEETKKEYIQFEPVQEVKPLKKVRGGLMSEYGLTWDLSDETIMNRKNLPNVRAIL